MTNGEKIKAILKPRKDQIRIYGNWVEIEIQRLDINFSCGLDWWNAEYKEPTTKNDLGVDCVARKDIERYIEGFINEYTPKEELEFINLELDGLKHLPSVTPQEPILDKIRAEIEKDAFTDVNDSKFIFVNHVNQIFDKYKGESEE